MTVQAVLKDSENLTMTIIAGFDVPVERVWELWMNPRQLEKWWGPPTYPATFVDHNLTSGGSARYYMTGPEGDIHWGWWKVIAVNAPDLLEFEDGFGNDDGTPNPDMPATVTTVTISGSDSSGTTMSIKTRFSSLEAMEQLLEMGMEEGMKLAMGQIDELLLIPAS